MRRLANNLRCFFFFRHRQQPSWWAWLGWRFGERLCDVLDIPELIRMRRYKSAMRTRVLALADQLPDEHRNTLYAAWGRTPKKRKAPCPNT